LRLRGLGLGRAEEGGDGWEGQGVVDGEGVDEQDEGGVVGGGGEEEAEAHEGREGPARAVFPLFWGED
jgi:hypothetical protein